MNIEDVENYVVANGFGLESSQIVAYDGEQGVSNEIWLSAGIRLLIKEGLFSHMQMISYVSKYLQGDYGYATADEWDDMGINENLLIPYGAYDSPLGDGKENYVYCRRIGDREISMCLWFER